jgi:hypothetical protein
MLRTNRCVIASPRLVGDVAISSPAEIAEPVPSAGGEGRASERHGGVIIEKAGINPATT